MLCVFVCVYRKEATHVRLGDFNYGSNHEHNKPMNVKVAEVILHPDYSKDGKKSLYNNIAVVQLDQSLDFAEHIRPACLPQVSDVVDESVSMTGWPFKLYNVPRSMRHKQDMTLRKYNMHLVDGTECKQLFILHSVDGMPNGITDTQICASIVMEDHDRHFKMLRPLEVRNFHIKDGHDFCPFASIIYLYSKFLMPTRKKMMCLEFQILDGAPLQTLQHNDQCMYTVLGLSHFKPTFGLMKVPLVFTRIYPYLSWIEQIVWPNH